MPGRKRFSFILQLGVVDLFIASCACILLRAHMQGIPGYYKNIAPLHTVYHPA